MDDDTLCAGGTCQDGACEGSSAPCDTTDICDEINGSCVPVNGIFDCASYGNPTTGGEFLVSGVDPPVTCNAGSDFACDPVDSCSCGCGTDIGNSECPCSKIYLDGGKAVCASPTCVLSTEENEGDGCTAGDVQVAECDRFPAGTCNAGCGTSNIEDVVQGNIDLVDSTAFTTMLTSCTDDGCAPIFTCSNLGVPVPFVGTLLCNGGYWGCDPGTTCECQIS